MTISNLFRPVLVIIIIAALLASAAALVFWSRPAAPASAQTSEDGVLVKQGSFLTNSTSGAQVVTGVGFQPKAVIFYWTGEDTATGTKDEVRLGVGLSNGIPSSDVRHSAAISGKYSVGSYTNTASSSRGQDITLFNSFNTTVSAKVNSLDSNGFTLSWAQASGGAYLIHFIAIGGSDITNTSVGEFVIDNTGLSNMGIDTGFKPDFVFMISNGVRDIVNTPAYPYPANLSLGFGSGPNNQGVVNIFSNNGSATSATCSRQRTDHIVSLVNSNCNSFVLAKLFSMYENGFSLTKVDSNATEQTVYYLAIKGGSWNVGSFNKKTSAGTQPVPLGDVDFVPNGLMLFSRNQTTNSNVTSNADFSIGAASGATNRGAVGVSGPDGAIALSPDRRTLTNKIFTHINGTGGTLVNEADLTSFDNEGFTLNWTNADANANEILYWAVGSKPTLEQSGYRWFENRDELDGAKGTVGGTQKVSELSGGGPVLDPSDLYGSSIASLGDLDGDGVSDLAVGADLDDDGGTDAGAIYVHFMNTNGTVKSTQKVTEGSGNGPTLDADDFYGRSIASLGDLDGDGVGDLAVGAVWDDDGGTNVGAIYIHFMNTNGTVKSTQKVSELSGGGPTLDAFDEYGSSIASLGDLDGDGIGDLAVGAYFDDDGGTNAGAIYVHFMNTNGTVKSTQKVTEGSGNGPTLDADDFYGRSIASLGDLDGDGVGDLAVGVFGDDDGGTDAGAIYIHFMNTNGTVKSTQKVSELSGGGPTLDDFDHYGSSIAFLGDLDGDGVSDIAVGANFDDDGWSAAGAIYVHFMNSGKALVGSSLASQNTAATLSSSTPPFRLQMLAHVGGGKLAKNGGDFRLQYAQKSGSCDTGFSGETYQNVETASDIIRFHNNDNLANGNVPLITTSTPTHSGHTRKAQVYRESSGSFSNSNTAISVGEDGLWDFSLKLANASSSTSYCFRVVNADASSTPFASYSVIPEIITPAATISFNELVQKNYRWYRGVDTKDPANNQAIADENAAMTNLAQNRSRHLRISVESPSGNLASGQTLKLQYQKSTTTGTWYNLGAADGAGTVRFSGADFGCCTDGVAITALRLTGSNVLQTYEEDNGSNDHLSAATPNAITVGKIAEWNWAIRIGIAEASATYYFRMAGSDGTPFASYTNYPKVVVLSSGGATSSGELSSVIYDTQSVNGAQLNSFFWDGPQPETNDYVRFQFASASTTSPAGGWDSLWKGPDGTSATWYGGGTPPTGPNATAAITPSNHANHRYFRYKVRLESSSGISPVVRRVIINWSP